ncbi:MbtH family protein [Goodfellowiella coeruleoviolacea]|uniref:MbtH protein n=1 Tax=Goodfellowiella coeruleoviolacea TaxID=334858 RepID=A0AAE3GI27_9PSEU|nr:MbtH family NRPS accessory protein [Goodfellowiella coeruleoviolacea]MCP2168581.1 MbtH protein [Goodfellowiella coeruleoviolacea]
MTTERGETTAENTGGPLTRVVVNHEEQYSIWPADREPPAGWTPVGVTGTEDECLDWIERTWTDLRPLSLRRAMAGNG